MACKYCHPDFGCDCQQTIDELMRALKHIAFYSFDVMSNDKDDLQAIKDYAYRVVSQYGN